MDKHGKSKHHMQNSIDKDIFIFLLEIKHSYIVICYSLSKHEIVSLEICFANLK